MNKIDEHSLTRPLQDKVDKDFGRTGQPVTGEQVLKMLDQKIRLKINLTPELIEEIGLSLIMNKANVNLVADEFHLEPYELRMLIKTEPVLAAYWSQAYVEIKSMVDSKVLARIEAGDDDWLKEVAKMMYRGRDKGAYNPNELGLLGYDDKMAQQQAEAVKDETSKGGEQTVNLVFGEVTIRLGKGQSAVDALLQEVEKDYIDAEEVDEDF